MSQPVPSVSVRYAQTGVSMQANVLGMRPMQERAFQKRGEQYLLIKSPPASGKSRALMFIALDKLHKQAIIVVPEKSIDSSFHDEALRSKSEEPFVAQNRHVLHKIGVTGGDVKSRVANAKKDPTYLLAEVEIVATFKLANINRKKLEALLHKFFSSARLDVALKDRFGSHVEPREWFLVPMPAIEEAIQKLQAGSLDQYHYDPTTARIVQNS